MAMKILCGRFGAALAMFAACGAPAMAQTAAYPSHQVTLVVPFSPSSGIDILARVIGPRLAQRWGEAVVVDNRAGASGNIGTDFVAKAAPNGYTLMVTVNTFAITPSLYKNIPYDVLTDFTPVSKIAVASYAFAVNPAVLPVKDLADFIATVKAKPGQFYYGSPGNGTPHHLAVELLKLHLGLNITHVPYKGLAGAMTDLLGGQVQMMFAPVHSSLPYARSGKLKILAVTGATRSPVAPDSPTFREQGINFMDDVDAWYAVLAPAKTPPEIVAKLNADLKAVLALPDAREALLAQGLVPVTSTPQELAALIKADVARWAKLVADARITAD
jgi:tripartite-type tricarboxylate transporter receptor subunit TctC